MDRQSITIKEMNLQKIRGKDPFKDEQQFRVEVTMMEPFSEGLRCSSDE